MIDAAGNGAAAFDRRLVHHEHLKTSLGSSHGGVEPGRPAPDDGNIGIDLMNLACFHINLSP